MWSPDFSLMSPAATYIYSMSPKAHPSCLGPYLIGNSELTPWGPRWTLPFGSVGQCYATP